MKKQTAVPLGIHGDWLDAEQLRVGDELRDWLLDPGSLTLRLKKLSQHFQVQVLFEGYSEITEDEHQLIAINDSNEALWVREVLLYCDHQPWVFARSVIPHSSLTGEAAAIAKLEDKPLGEFLFSHPEIHREQFQLLKLDDQSALAQQFSPGCHLYGRRSRFTLKDAPLSVAEIFLPASGIYSSTQQGS